jgi:hypothetical protein
MSLKKRYLSIKLLSPFRRTVNHFPINSENSDKVKSQEIELEQCKDIILKLKKQLHESKNEVHLLKINKIILENEHFKTINNLKTFLKNSDPEMREKYKSIEQNFSYNPENEDLIEKQEKTEDNTKDNNEIEDNIVVSKKTMLNRRRNKIKIQNFLKLDTLRQHINSLNEELMRKNNLITELQNNKKVRGYKELQKSLIKNCNQINEKLQEENYRIKNKCDSLIYLLKNEQNENRALKEKLRRFNERFVIFKELSINKVKKLDEELNIAKEKERNLNIRIIGDQDKEKIENHNKTEEYNNMKNKIMQNEIDLKKNGEIIRKYKNENLNIREENKKLKKEKVVLEINNNRLIKENEEMKNKIKEMNKKMKDLEDKLKKGEKIFFTDLNKENNKKNKNKNKNKEENEFNDDYEE